jgi:hypothetical protein
MVTRHRARQRAFGSLQIRCAEAFHQSIADRREKPSRISRPTCPYPIAIRGNVDVVINLV